MITTAVKSALGIYDHVMPPRNLCNKLLHKFLIRVGFGEFGHIFEVTHGIALSIRIFQPQVTGQVFDELVPPDFI